MKDQTDQAVDIELGACADCPHYSCFSAVQQDDNGHRLIKCDEVPKNSEGVRPRVPAQTGLSFYGQCPLSKAFKARFQRRLHRLSQDLAA